MKSFKDSPLLIQAVKSNTISALNSFRHWLQDRDEEISGVSIIENALIYSQKEFERFSNNIEYLSAFLLRKTIRESITKGLFKKEMLNFLLISVQAFPSAKPDEELRNKIIDVIEILIIEIDPDVYPEI